MLQMPSRHAREVARAIARHQYEVMEGGDILLPKMHAKAQGLYILTDRKSGELIEEVPNLLPTEGLNLILNLLGNHASIPTCYITLFSTNYTPVAADTAATFVATYGEITSGSEGYSQSTRVAWVPATAASAAVNNYVSPAVFTIVTAGTLTVRGVAMLTASAKSAGTGALVSAAKFAAARTFANTDEFDVKYQIGLTSS